MVKRYVIKWEHDLYWADEGRVVRDVEKALIFKKDELPAYLQKRQLYKMGDNPLKWFYISTCGNMSRIEEADECV